ncbi:MAG: helix-turn-helix transcriptional regulator [Campylobacterales bacterium]|nr:helix-turn-helix transcriptional regulator [Campylobacterales bacterium]
MNIICHESPFIDSVYYVPVEAYPEKQDFHFIGAPSIHEHIILNNDCAIITFDVGGKVYECHGHIVCGKFTHAPKIKITFKNKGEKLTVIRLTSCGLYQLTDMPVASIVDRIVSGSFLDIDLSPDTLAETCIQHIDAILSTETANSSYILTQEIIRYVNANFAHLPTNATKAVAMKFGISESSLRRYFKKYLGINLSTYIITVKRKKMIQALYEDNYDSLSVRENGYYDQSHFLNDFKRLYGVPLKQYFNEMQAIKKRAPDLMRFIYHCNIQSNV